MQDVGVPTQITLTNSGTEAQRKHTMAGSSGRVLVTCLSDLVGANYLVHYAINGNAATPSERDGAIPPGSVEREIAGPVGVGGYISFYAGADIAISVQEVSGTREAGGSVYAGNGSAVKTAVDLVTAAVNLVKTAVDLVTTAVNALRLPGNAFINVDTTNVGAGPTYYPGATGITMDNWKNLSFSGKMIEGDAEANVVTIQVTDDEDTANADWQTVYFFDNISNTWVANYTCNATTTQMAASLDGLNFRYVRVKFVGGASATNTLILKARVTP